MVDCVPPTENILKVRFKGLDGTTKAVVFDAVKDAKNDIIFFDSSDSLSLFELPIDLRENTLLYLFVKDGVTDSLFISYENKFILIDEDCGAGFILSDLDTIATSFDSLRIIDRRFLEEISTNIEIFR